ncbi:hypothetical protein BGZ60DRAFT_523079 [Tricladium varicosporioides]|nr:hypothetical protein BGZ60DRAFT_523079 [Hymenoscyphus varicosporioides]
MAKLMGYDKLANFMATSHYTIFRKFRQSAIRDLLYLQAEISELEKEYAESAQRDREAEGARALYDGNWHLLSISKSQNLGGVQWDKALQIRKKLREYYDCLSRYSDISTRERPRTTEALLLKDWILRPDLGGGISFSGKDLGPKTSVYNEVEDLLTLNPHTGENDLFTRFLTGPVFDRAERVLRVFRKPKQSDPEDQCSESNLFQYSDSHMITVVDMLGTVLASATPLISIIILYFVRNLGLRLIILCAFTLLFSLSLAVVTKARRVEIFACTAA